MASRRYRSRRGLSGLTAQRQGPLPVEILALLPLDERHRKRLITAAKA
jgi:hypothetical protein